MKKVNISAHVIQAVIVSAIFFTLTPIFITSAFAATDTDGDGVDDSSDNCTLTANPAQRDTDTDGYGNFCDPDFNNDFIVNGLDVGYFKSNFGTNDPDADLNGDGVVNGLDVGYFKSMFGQPPGPSYVDLPGQASLYYPLLIGNTWQYFVTINETGQPTQTEYTYTNISKITDFNNASVYNFKADLLTLAYENENSFYSEENDGIYLHGFFDENSDGEGFSVKITVTSPVLFLKSTFIVGDTWSTTTDMVFEEEGVVTDTVPSTWKYSVIAVEDVTVPAGTFQNCYKILMEVSSGNPVTIETDTIWFAENVGIVKRGAGDGTHTDELQYASINGINHGQEEIYQLSNASLNDTYIYKTQSTLLSPTSTENWSSTNSLTFYGNGNCSYTGILDIIVRTDNVTPRTVESYTGIPVNSACTYSLTSEGALTIDSILGTTSYAVNPDTDTIVGINADQNTDIVGSSAETMIKQSSGLSNANLIGTYLLNAQSMVLTPTSTEVWSWADSITFDGNGNCNYIGISENSTIRTDNVSPRIVESFTETPDDGSCTYNLTSDGTLAIDGNASYVFGPDDAIIVGNNYFSGTDVATSIEVMVKQSSGLSNASLTGTYMLSGREADLTDPAITQFWIWTGNMTFDGNGNCSYTGTTEEGVIRTDNVTPRTTELFIGAPDNSLCTYSLSSDGTLAIVWQDTGATFSYAVNHDTTIIAGTNVFTGGVASSVIERMVKSSNDGVAADNCDISGWEKYLNNPIFSSSGPMEWDDPLMSGTVLKDNDEPVNKYKRWYVGGATSFGEGMSLGYATSSDGINWIPYSNNPVMTHGNTWDINGFLGISVIKDGSTYKLWYEGVDVNGVNKIGYATSSDGINWTPHQNNPVFSPGVSNSWDDDDVGNPWIIKEDLTYKMWYWGDNQVTDTDQIGLAISADGINWQRSVNNPVLSPNPAIMWENGEGVGSPKVIKNTSGYSMAYHGADISGAVRIGFATSSDGATWSKDNNNPILDIGSVNDWDSAAVVPDALIDDSTSLKLWFLGVDSYGAVNVGLAVTCK